MRGLCLVLIALSAVHIGRAQEFDEPFDFYVYDMDEAAGLFQNTFRDIEDLESGTISEEEDINHLIHAAYSRDIADNELASLFFRAFFRETRNPHLQAVVKTHFGGLIGSEEGRAIRRRNAAQMTETDDGAIRYVWNDEFYDEDIKFNRLIRVSSADEVCSIYLPDSDWQSFGFSLSTGNVSYMAGGQTTSISVKVSVDGFEDLPTVSDPDGKGHRYDISEFGVSAYNNAQMTILEILHSDESDFLFNLKFYDNENKNVYKVRFAYNISPININYEIFNLMKKHLLYIAFLAHLGD